MPSIPHFRCDDVKKTENTLEDYWGKGTDGIEWNALYLGISLDFITFRMQNALKHQLVKGLILNLDIGFKRSC